MDIKQQLRKYKIQINELVDAWRISREREINIHKAEIERIAAKKAEFHENCETEAKSLNVLKMNILEEISGEQSKLSKIGAELNQLNNTKFKLRQEVLLQIQAENLAKKNIKRSRAIFENQLLDIQNQIDEQKKIINNYETDRRYINEDFYNWREECAEIQKKIFELSPNDRKTGILKDYLNELGTDTRANPENRYKLLDDSKTQAESKIEQLGYQYNKLRVYMNSFNESLVSQGEQVMSSYLRDASAQIPHLKNQQRELNDKIKVLGDKVSEIEDKIIALETQDIPAELKEQTERAEKRLIISGERLAAEYEPLIKKIREQVESLEQELLNSVPSANITSNTQPIAVDSNKCDYTDANEWASYNPGNEQQLNLEGKTRKEIERIKKRQRAIALDLD